MKMQHIKKDRVYIVNGASVAKCLGQHNRDHFNFRIYWPFPRDACMKPREVTREAIPEDCPTDDLRSKLFPSEVSE